MGGKKHIPAHLLPRSFPESRWEKPASFAPPPLPTEEEIALPEEEDAGEDEGGASGEKGKDEKQSSDKQKEKDEKKEAYDAPVIGRWTRVVKQEPPKEENKPDEGEESKETLAKDLKAAAAHKRTAIEFTEKETPQLKVCSRRGKEREERVGERRGEGRGGSAQNPSQGGHLSHPSVCLFQRPAGEAAVSSGGISFQMKKKTPTGNIRQRGFGL